MSDITDPLNIIANPPAMTVTEKPWGREFTITLGPYLVKVIRVEEGEMTSLQYHEHKREVQYVLETDVLTDEGGLIVDGQLQPRRVAVPIDRGVVHRTFGPELHLEISTNHPNDVVRLADGYGR